METEEYNAGIHAEETEVKNLCSDIFCVSYALDLVELKRGCIQLKC